MKKLCLAAALLSLAMASCQTRSSGENPAEGPFTVTVRLSSGEPVEGAIIEGGIDWDSFEIATDADGHATLASSAWGVEATIHLDNYFPLRVSLKSPFEYELTPTPKRLRLLGNIEGKAVRFAPGRLATVDYLGKYHLYAFDDSGLTEIASADVAKSVKQIQLIEDTLWISTHEDGVFAYSLADPERPQEELHLDIPGYTPFFALHDNVIVVAGYDDVSPLGIYTFTADGSFEETARFGNFYITSVAFLEGYLVVTGSHWAHPCIYDVSNPADPRLLYCDANPAYHGGVLYRHQYLQIPQRDHITENTVYGRVDLTNPVTPWISGVVKADSQLISVVDDSTAIGYYYAMFNTLSVLKGGLATGFRTAAIISEDPKCDLNEFGGCAPPYFVISNRLWILEDRADLSKLDSPLLR
jgi:hypothetical protein